jgi:hypothetical protein
LSSFHAEQLNENTEQTLGRTTLLRILLGSEQHIASLCEVVKFLSAELILRKE